VLDNHYLLVVMRDTVTGAVGFQMTGAPISTIELLGVVEFIRLYAQRLAGEDLRQTMDATAASKSKEAANASQ
jgi:hypothetical protein